VEIRQLVGLPVKAEWQCAGRSSGSAAQTTTFIFCFYALEHPWQSDHSENGLSIFGDGRKKAGPLVCKDAFCRKVSQWVSHFDPLAELDYLRLIFRKKRVKICHF
jgi:hypothetical protein